MTGYVDGFVIPIPKRNLAAYRRMAKLGAKIWREYGALAYCECAADDLETKWGMGFKRPYGLRRGETVVFSWIVFRSRAHRDRVNAAVMRDPRMNDPAMQKAMPFDPKRMSYGGFATLVAWSQAGVS